MINFTSYIFIVFIKLWALCGSFFNEMTFTASQTLIVTLCSKLHMITCYCFIVPFPKY